MEKYNYLLIIIVFLGIIALVFPLKLSKSTISATLIHQKPDRNLTAADKKTTYVYEDIYSKLTSEDMVLEPVGGGYGFISQIFSEGKVWAFTSNKGSRLYLIDGDNKTQANVVNDEKLTDKVVSLDTTEFDLDGDGIEELIALSVLNFKDAALCCDQKRFLNIFRRDNNREWKLFKEEELDVFHGGNHEGEVSTLRIKGQPVIQVKIVGIYNNGLNNSTVEWYAWENEPRKIWKEHLSYNTDMVGTYPEAALDNYEASFTLNSSRGWDYPSVEVTRDYRKRRGKFLITPELEKIVYTWDTRKNIFEQMR